MSRSAPAPAPYSAKAPTTASSPARTATRHYGAPAPRSSCNGSASPFSCERIEVERDDDGRKHGITYRATVTRRLPDGSLDTLATCEGTADYDESKFYQSAEQVKARLRDQEHKWAAKDRRVPNADRWNSAKEYRADWNALMKRAQKRAIVGAVVDATAAGGIFSDREEDDTPARPAADEGPSLAQPPARRGGHLHDRGGRRRKIWRDAAAAAREGLCTPAQATHIQNRVKVRSQSLQQNAQPVHVGDLARQAAKDASPAEQQRAPAPRCRSGRAPQGARGGGPHAQPGRAGRQRLRHTRHGHPAAADEARRDVHRPRLHQQGTRAAPRGRVADHRPGHRIIVGPVPRRGAASSSTRSTASTGHGRSSSRCWPGRCPAMSDARARSGGSRTFGEPVVVGVDAGRGDDRHVGACWYFDATQREHFQRLFMEAERQAEAWARESTDG